VTPGRPKAQPGRPPAKRTLIIAEKLNEALVRRAATEHRSVNAQILVFIERGLETPTDAQQMAERISAAALPQRQEPR
jgi:hypothetical protein